MQKSPPPYKCAMRALHKCQHHDRRYRVESSLLHGSRNCDLSVEALYACTAEHHETHPQKTFAHICSEKRMNSSSSFLVARWLFAATTCSMLSVHPSLKNGSVVISEVNQLDMWALVESTLSHETRVSFHQGMTDKSYSTVEEATHKLPCEYGC